MRHFMMVVAVVPAFNRADSIAATLSSLRSTGVVQHIVVVDDGSTDRTASEAAVADNVVCFAANQGKAAAMHRGMKEYPDADVYLFVDADLGDTAVTVAALLDPILRDEADLVIGVPTEAAGRRAGLGLVRSLASLGIERACGFSTKTPLSGQRAVRGKLARSLTFANRFGVETAMTIDCVRAGARVVEVPIAFDHRHTGKSLTGFMHRGGQGFDIVRALSPRLIQPWLRTTLKVSLAVLLLALSLVFSRPGSSSNATLIGERTKAAKVLVLGVTRLQLSDLRPAITPSITKLLFPGDQPRSKGTRLWERARVFERATDWPACSSQMSASGRSAPVSWRQVEPVERRKGRYLFQRWGRPSGSTPENSFRACPERSLTPFMLRE
jgi:Glycosyl transferase family 2